MGLNRLIDQYQLRLPPGLRDRIKAYAEAHGRSMNTEIVRVLEAEFPEPLSLKERLEELTLAFAALKKVRGYEGAIDNLGAEILKTLAEIQQGRAPDVDDETRQEIGDILAAFQTVHNWKTATRRDWLDKNLPSGEADE